MNRMIKYCLEFKVKVNNGECLQRVCSHLIVHFINVESDFIMLS